MNVKQITEQYLIANGFDGLLNEDCGCVLGELFLCEGSEDENTCASCIPGYKQKADPDLDEHRFYQWIVTEEKPDGMQS